MTDSTMYPSTLNERVIWIWNEKLKEVSENIELKAPKGS